MASDGFEWMDHGPRTTTTSRRYRVDRPRELDDLAQLRERVRRLQAQLDEAQSRAGAIHDEPARWIPPLAARSGVLQGLVRGIGRARHALEPLAAELAQSSPRQLLGRATAQLALVLMMRARDALDTAIAARH
jgi:hypothetical protein